MNRTTETRVLGKIYFVSFEFVNKDNKEQIIAFEVMKEPEGWMFRQYDYLPSEKEFIKIKKQVQVIDNKYHETAEHAIKACEDYIHRTVDQDKWILDDISPVTLDIHPMTPQVMSYYEHAV